ncbi:PQQ-binding-like beta-propeller repeat protein [Rubripirellula obstinata]|nr:PQQ-binding-like beta-propeller repeat protein [Rubripirellula obstinata]
MLVPPSMQTLSMRIASSYFSALILIACVFAPSVRSETWPTWRGQAGDNHAASGNQVPENWDLTSGKNIVWKTAIPGRGHSSPVVTDDAIFLTTADNEKKTQSLLKLDRESGKLIGETVLHRNGLPERIHPSNSHASPTPAFDGQHLFVCFHTNDSIVLSKVTPEGQIDWQKKVCDFKPDQFQFGYGASPVIEDNVVIVAAEYDGAGCGLYGLDRETGKQVWKAPRPINLSFSSPIVATVGGTRQLFLAGASTINSYDPADGKLLWSIDESTDAICGTVVWDDRNVFISGGYPGKGTWCVSGDGTKVRVWDNRVKCYEQSLLRFGDHLLALDDNGIGHCIDANDGESVWKKRLFDGKVSASPLLVADRIYTASEDGGVVVISTNTEKCEILAENQTGNSIFASPVVVDNRLYLRPAVGFGQDRQEYLVAIGRSAAGPPK